MPAILHPAFSWTCDACGRDQFARALPYDGPPLCRTCRHTEADHAGPGPWRPRRLCEYSACKCEDFVPLTTDGTIWVEPNWVRCEACGFEYDTEKH